ncbi:SusC/RagA family TonB-linked outer membrane protein [Chitinophaga ginsengisoli]|uniref:TonB-linked SusC/RagA family outer membrane protein n=1 Tax=Chitinophaga ginsengisoli TaxID=363837 RepID=A0A2P8GQ68_9BACT|nr:SusC/RagA family TonB-linked outer membrane protein [Chitinophaga ginsengisoli]PSL36107.1 TonB-linked SusC/RagA family outer membrane protein [Chitinophaga ginsengisoli]
MRLSVRIVFYKGVFLLATILLLFIQHECIAQSGSIRDKSLTVTITNMPLSTVLKTIQDMSGITIYFNSSEISQFQNITLEAKNESFSHIMRKVLEPRGLEYREISAVAVAVAFKKAERFAEKLIIDTSRSIQGKLISEEGQPIEGASIQVAGTGNGAVSGPDGSFLINNIPAKTKLVITNVSFLSKEVTVGSKSNLGIIVLKHFVGDLEETVVKGYYTTKKKFNTGGVVTIKGEDIARQPVSNPLLAIQGRVPNLVITPTNGLPNGPVFLQLRGQNSISVTNGQRMPTQPLIVVDGVPYQNNISSGGGDATFGSVGSQISALSFINPNDIERIDILADADATSIYGSRGGNGVILITTKRGREGKTSIGINVSTGYNEVPSKIELLNTQQYLQMRRNAFKSDGLAVPDHSSPVKTYENYDLTVWDTARYTDWQEKFLGRLAPFTNANLSINGGNQLMQFLLSGNYNRSKLVYPGDNNYETATVNFNLGTSSANNKFRTLFGGTYVYNNSFSPTTDFARLAVVLAPNAPSIYDKEGNLNWEKLPDVQNDASTWTNPYAQLLVTTTSKTNSVRGSIDISYQILQNLFIKTSAGYTETNTRNLSLTPLASFDPSMSNKVSLAVHNNVQAKSLTVDPQIGYNVNIGKGKLEALALLSYQSQSEYTETSTGQNFSSDVLLGSLENAALITGANTSMQYKYVALSGRLAYNWDGKYLVNLTTRRDGSSRFGPGYQFGSFWSVGTGWIFTEENFMKGKLPFLNFGKLRFSYGTSGNDVIGDYAYIELFQGNKNFAYQGGSVLLTNGAVNPDYHWETIKKLETALEASMLNGRVTTSVAYWRTRASDQLGNYPLPSTAGADVVTRNQDAVIQNSGWDFIVNSKNIASKALQWSSTISFGILKNKLLAKPEGLYNNFGLNRFVEVGKPFAGFVAVYEYKGVNPATGFYQFADKAGNVTTSLFNSYDEAKKVVIQPLTLGLSNSISFKGFTLDFFIQFTKQVGRNYLLDEAFSRYSSLNYGNFLSMPYLEYGNLPVELLNHWQKPGDVAAIQKFSTKRFDYPLRDLYSRAKSSDLAWTDASFIKLRTLSLGYNFPANINTKLKTQNIRVYIQAQNLLTITNYKGLDPETQSATVLPQLRTVAGGIQVRF